MQKQFLFILVFLFTICAFQSTKAQLRYGASANVSIPSNEIADIFSVGLGLQGDVYYDVTDHFFVGLNGAYNYYLLKSEFQGEGFTFTSTTAKLTANYGFGEPGGFNPFVSGGVGLYQLELNDFFGKATDLKAGLNVGAGTFIGGFKVEGKFNLVKDFNYAGISIGYMWGN